MGNSRPTIMELKVLKKIFIGLYIILDLHLSLDEEKPQRQFVQI